jgi:hypothetical protein
MPRLTNATREVVNLVVKDGKVTNGVPETTHLEPGETANVNCDINSAFVQGMIIAGVLIADDKTTEKVAAATEDQTIHPGSTARGRVSR